MKIIVQRVYSASCTVDGEVISEIGPGYLLYSCFEDGDEENCIEKAVTKIKNLRIFEDEAQKMNQSIVDVGGEILNISQFTLAWDGKKGNRPSFEKAMNPQKAEQFYRAMNSQLRMASLKIKEGLFGADMKIQSLNDGPVTFHLSF